MPHPLPSTQIAQYHTAIHTVLRLILDRFERDPDYGLIDMKFDLLSGQDFPADDPIRGRNAVYGWIQGRGLEALAGHAAYVGRGETCDRIRRVVRRLIERTEQLRADAGGRLRFLMTPAGQALTIDPAGRPRPIANDGPSHYTDLFYAKGLAAGARLLGDHARLNLAREMFATVLADLTAGRFVSDQEPLDPRNPVRHTPGQLPHGPWMIAIGGMSVFHPWLGRAAHEHGRAARATDLIGHVLDHYTTPDGDMWELNDASGKPLIIDGVQRTDPGHATEFAGLSLKFLRLAREPRGELHDRLCRVLVRNFELGTGTFSAADIAASHPSSTIGGKGDSPLGIVKAVNLLTRRAINTDMPWWSLPETIRAAIEAWRLDHDEQYAIIARRCSDAFIRHYLRADRWLCANQTVDETGRPVARIPATPDVDPGYHTGLSLIDALA